MTTPIHNTLTWWDYVKAAFGWRYKLPLLGFVRLNIMGLTAFSILGFGQPAFWLLGMALETMYLMLLSGNERFQKLAQGRQLLAFQDQWAKKQSDLFNMIDPKSQNRYLILFKQCGAIIKNAGTGPLVDTLKTHGIGQLLSTFLQLLVSERRIKLILSVVHRQELLQEIDLLQKKEAAATPESALCRSIQGSLEIAKKRLDNLSKASDSLQVIEAELSRIEKQFALLYEESSISTQPSDLTLRLDTIMHSLQTTSQWMAENKDLLGGLEDVDKTFSLNPEKLTGSLIEGL